MSAVLDTHTVLWYLENSKELSPVARTTIEDAIRDALSDPSIGLFIAPVDASVANALEKIPRTIVPDMPDRIIAATALHLGLPLVTRDRRLHSAGIQTVW